MKRGIFLLTLLLVLHTSTGAAFELTDTKGHIHRLASYQGRWVLLNIWASWCEPCIAELPTLAALADSEKNLAVLGLAVDSIGSKRLNQLSEQFALHYPQVDGNAVSARQFNAKGYPTSILFDPAGRKVLIKEGIISREEILLLIHPSRTHDQAQESRH